MEQQQDLGHPRTPLEHLRLFVTGFFMGAADIVPGVSGGTIAFIMGIYETLVNAIKSFNLDALRLAAERKFAALAEHTSLRFLIAVGLGILAAVFTLANVLGGLLETQPTYIFALFGGLVMASIIAIAPGVKWSGLPIAGLVIGALVAFWLTGLDALNPANVSHDLPVLFFSGSVAIIAMILPGISGSFILVILGQYDYVLSLVRERNLLPLIVIALGCAVGIVVFSRILSFLLKHYRSITLAVLVGFMVGSLRKLWIEASLGAERMTAADNTPSIVLVIGLIVLGFIVVTLLDHASSKNNPIVRRVLG